MTTQPDAPQFLPAGDTALVVQFGEVIDPKINQRVVRLKSALASAELEGVVDLVPTFRSLLIHYDPLKTSQADLREAVTARLNETGVAKGTRRRWSIPVCYEGAHAPDLASVAEAMSISEDEVVRRHSDHRFDVFMMGFLPGHPYLGILPEEFNLPRLTEPRVKVPPRSISVAQRQTTIYTIECPGGWHLIGQSPVEFFDFAQDPPILLSAGDQVEFDPISAKAYVELRERVASGDYHPTSVTFET
jgi:inhibitor of KinA